MKRIIPIFITILFLSSTLVHAEVKKEKRLWQDETIYSLMIDRFNDGDTRNDISTNTKDLLAYNGGDFQGIIDKLDYIKDMGFTAIRLTPIFDNTQNGYHGYWVKDFYNTDEHFGSIKTFKKLVKEAHKRKIKVVIDFVTNNVAKDHEWVSDPSKKDWFHKNTIIQDWNDQKVVETGWVDGLPDLNQDNPEVRKYLIDTGKWWIQKTNIDGYTLPDVNAVPISFWSDFAKEVKQVKKNFFLMGLPLNQTALDKSQYEPVGIDSIFNDAHSRNLREAFATTNQSFKPLINDSIKEKNEYLDANYFDHENTVRFTRDIVDKRQFPGSRWKSALVYSYTTPGIPVFYYGTEIALNGGEIPDNRRQMNFRTEKELIDYITQLGDLRDRLPSLTRGTMEVLYEKAGLIVYKRTYKEETAVIVINNTKESQHISLSDTQIEGGKELRGLLEGNTSKSNDKNRYEIILDRDKSEIFVLTKKTGINYTLIGLLVLVYVLVFLFLRKLKFRK